MAYIALNNEELPGIVGLLNYRQDTGAILNQLVETLLRQPSSLSPGERETIASYVSHLNNCHFCHTVHGAVAAHHLQKELNYIDDIKQGVKPEDASPKLKSLLNIAAKVQKSGKNVLETDIAAARKEGATDMEIHDTVLIAAAFCMFNRYVDGLGTWAPEPKEAYGEMGKMLAETGYVGTEAGGPPQN
jgi:uncharacterized peroxidase-related enzyme